MYLYTILPLFICFQSQFFLYHSLYRLIVCQFASSLCNVLFCIILRMENVRSNNIKISEMVCEWPQVLVQRRCIYIRSSHCSFVSKVNFFGDINSINSNLCRGQKDSSTFVRQLYFAEVQNPLTSFSLQLFWKLAEAFWRCLLPCYLN